MTVNWDDYGDVVEQKKESVNWDDYGDVGSEAKAVKPVEEGKKSKPSVVMDIINSAGQGSIEGLAAMTGFPTDVYNFAQNKIGKLGWEAANAVLGEDRPYESPTELPFGSRNIINAVNKGIPEYTPKTTAGDYTRTLMQFAPAAGKAGAEGVWSGAKHLASRVGAPAIASETSGQLTKGTELEPYARVAGAVLGAGGAGLVNRARDPESFLSSRVGNVTKEEYAQAQALMDKAAEFGTPISVSEALSKVTNGRTMLPEAQRVLEQTPKGGPTLRDFYKDRPQSNTQAAGKVMDTVSNKTANPSMIAEGVRNAASEELSNVRAFINKQTKPFYKASKTTEIPMDAYEELSKNPSFQKALADVQGDPELAQKIIGLPSNSVGVLNEVKKRLKTLENKVSNVGTETYDQYKASMRGTTGTQVRNTAAEASPEYAQALEQQASMRNELLSPLEQGPLGKLAKSKDITQQHRALFPQNPPVVGMEQEVSDAISRITNIDPKTTQALVRQHLETSFNKATKDLVSGPNQYGAAKFASNIAGTEQQASNLEAAIRALPDGEAKWSQVSNMLDVFKAQGHRLPVGSATEFNKMIAADLGKGTAVQEAVDTAMSPSKWFSAVADKGREMRARAVSGDVAKLLTDPKGAEKLMNMQHNPLTIEDYYKLAPYPYQYRSSK